DGAGRARQPRSPVPLVSQEPRPDRRDGAHRGDRVSTAESDVGLREMSEPTVLFVCLHGAAKSVIAAAEFERLARARGVAARAVSAGTEPDPQIAPVVVARLLEEGIDLRGLRPRRVTRQDVAQASRVVSFGCDLGDLAVAGVEVERWDDVPAVSDDFDRARAAIRARVAAVAAQTPETRAQAENALTGALRQLFALAEAYPDIKANANFIQLQGSLSEIEDAIQSARRYYNAVVRDLNTSVQTFPSNFVASFFQFHPRGYFELDSPQERQAPRVAFGS